VTKGGLVFGEGKFRPYHEDFDTVLWSAPFVGNALGLPASL
jgi:hypothetical protein